jgi:tRNA pseudouridine55 synthase
LRQSHKYLLEDRVLNIDKKASVTSYGAVDQLKKLLGVSKAGHAGTLDPFATGVLLVCTGKATKITRFLMELEKEYVGTIKFGSETETDDRTGKVIFSREDFSISKEDIEKEMSAFLGRILQRPPRVSALKQRGVRLYEMARRGESFETEAREVTVRDFKILEFRFPKLDFLVQCSKGTYVRALARDIGKKLGCGAHLDALRRVRIGSFAVEDAMSVESLKDIVEAGELASCSRSAMSIDEALSFMPAYTLKESVEQKVVHGLSPALSEFDRLEAGVPANQNVRILSSRGEFLAIGRTPSSDRDNVIRLEKVMAETHG